MLRTLNGLLRFSTNQRPQTVIPRETFYSAVSSVSAIAGAYVSQ